MGDHEDCCAEVFVHVVNELDDVDAGGGVEVAGRFIGEEDGRVDGEGAGDGDALALASGQFIG